MTGAQVFVGIWAIASVVVSALAVWRIAKSSRMAYKPLWIIGSLFGFFGFTTSVGVPGDLHIGLGIQIPVLFISSAVNGGIALTAMFPIVAAVALMINDASGGSPNIADEGE